MKREDWLGIAGEAYDLSQVQQKTFRAGKGDNGKRTPRDLYTNDAFWKYLGIVVWQLGKVADGLITSTTTDEKGKRRIRFLSALVTFLDRFASLPHESQDRVDGTSIIKNRGIDD